MPIDVPEEGDEVTKAVADAWFSTIAARLNALTPDDIGDRTFDTQLPDMVVHSQTVEISASSHLYTGATAPYTGYDAGTASWLIVGASKASPELLSMTFTDIEVATHTNNAFAAAILIFCNIRVARVYDDDGGTGYPTYQQLAPLFAVFKLQMEKATSGWVDITPTEEIINNMGPDNVSWAFCLNTLIEGFSEDITGIRALVAVSRQSVTATDAIVELKDANLTVVALRSGYVS